jgi:phosphoglycolate phosphatase
MVFYACRGVYVGVLWNGETTVAMAPEVIQRIQALGKRCLFITNNSTKSRVQAAAKFKKLGFGGVTDEDIVTSGSLAAEYICSLPTSEFDIRTEKVFAVGMQGLLDELRGVGCLLVTSTDCGPQRICGSPTAAEFVELGEDVDTKAPIGAVVVGMDTGFDYHTLAAASLALNSSLRPAAHFVATNLDAADNVGTGDQPRLMPGAGGIVAAISAASGRQYVNVGKGGDWVLSYMVTRFGLDPARTLMIGDRTDTDISFGKTAGMLTLLPFTGVTSRSAVKRADATQRPDFVCTSIAELF